MLKRNVLRRMFYYWLGVVSLGSLSIVAAFEARADHISGDKVILFDSAVDFVPMEKDAPQYADYKSALCDALNDCIKHIDGECSLSSGNVYMDSTFYRRRGEEYERFCQ